MLERPLVFVDIDTQRDFLEESGALFVPGSRSIVPNLERLSRFADARGIPVVATACRHSPGDPELSQFPPHCMAGTDGQRRIAATERPGSVVLGLGDRLRYLDLSRLVGVVPDPVGLTSGTHARGPDGSVELTTSDAPAQNSSRQLKVGE